MAYRSCAQVARFQSRDAPYPREEGERFIRQQMQEHRIAARAYTRRHGEDDPRIRDWTWPY